MPTASASRSESQPPSLRSFTVSSRRQGALAARLVTEIDDLDLTLPVQIDARNAENVG